MEKIRGDYLTRFTSRYKKPMAKQPVSVLLPEEIDNFVRSLPNRTEWLREAITQKYQECLEKKDG